jgi:hypothetical protein
MKNWIVFLIYLFCVSCNVSWSSFLPANTSKSSNNQNKTVINPDFLNSIKSGDLIFRASNDLISTFFRNINKRHQDFSHIGIAVIENNNVYVMHIIKNDETPEKSMRKDLLSDFWNKNQYTSFGKASPNFNNKQINKFIKVADSINKLPIAFDNEINIESINQLYCTEYVALCIKIASQNKTQVPTTLVNNKRGFAPDNFYNNTICNKIEIYAKNTSNIFINN